MNRQVLKEPISVEYIDHMGSDIRVSNVAKTSFAKWEDESIAIDAKQKGLLKYLATGLPSSERSDWEARAKASVHWSPYAHCFLSVRCAAPIFLTRQLLKHQVGLSWNEESRRYITDDVAIWVPDVVHKAPEHAKQGASKEAHEDILGDYYHTARDVIENSTASQVEVYYNLLDAGVAPEEARIVLPQNAVTHWVWSGSLMAMMRIVKQRVDSHAQNAAQDFGLKLLTIVEDKFPHSVEAFELSQQ